MSSYLHRSAAFLLSLFCTTVANTSRGNIAFNFVPDPGTPQYVVDGFNLAAAKYSAVLANDITVNVQIGWQSLGIQVLGQTSYSYVTAEYSAVTTALNASATSADDRSACAHLQTGSSYSRLVNQTTDNPNPATATPYVNSLSTVAMTRANAKALGLLAPSSSFDASIRMNSDKAFDFNPADGTTSGQYDFATIAAHELGHVLGFSSVVNQIEQQSGTASQFPATVLDLFRYSADSLAAGAGYIDTTADPRSKFFSVNGGSIGVAQMANGAIYGSGYQADHWKEWSFTGLMDPQSFTGLQRGLRQADLTAFDVIGYELPEPASGALLVVGGLFLFACRRR